MPGRISLLPGNHLSNFKAMIGSFEKEFAMKNPGRTQILRFMREALDVDEVKWESLTHLNLVSVAEHIRSCVSPNSAVTYLAIVKAFLAQYKDEGVVPCSNPAKALKAKKVPQQNVALTLDELNKIERYYDRLLAKGGHQAEKDALTLFLLECFCGARGCDVENMTLENIKDGKLTYVSQKTQILATIPVHRRLEDLLSRKPKKQYTACTKNRIIKRVAERCGISDPVTIFYHGSMQTKPKYEYLGTHTARRTFSSILAANGTPIPEISQFMGHSEISMTERYIKVDMNTVSQAAMAFFNA